MEQNVFRQPAKSIKTIFSIQSFEKYFLRSNENMIELSKIIKNCKADQLHCRFNIWRLCLGVVSHQSSLQEKIQQIKVSRQKYHQKKQEALKSISKVSPIKQQKKNPLMMMGGKPQAKQTESDKFLKQQIQKDVDRTYQEMKFFQNQAILKLLNLILFVWCRRNPEVSYKQGMNELLASVVVCYFQQAEFRQENDKPEQISQDLWKNHLYFNSSSHAEEDIYNVFQKIINIQGDMYKTQADQCLKTKVNPNSKNNTPILQRIIQIKDHKLKHMDLELFRIIKLQDVQTKSFMLRWIRCMHTREFSLENSFVIWDSIFLEYWESPQSKKKGQFQFLDCMCLAMFMYMRSIVFTKQTAGQILQVYQKYPALKKGEYLDQLITLAWTICQQLRLENQNLQAPGNWFQQSQNIKRLRFMNKAPQSNQSKSTSHANKKNQLQLRQKSEQKRNNGAHRKAQQIPKYEDNKLAPSTKTQKNHSPTNEQQKKPTVIETVVHSSPQIFKAKIDLKQKPQQKQQQKQKSSHDSHQNISSIPIQKPSHIHSKQQQNHHKNLSSTSLTFQSHQINEMITHLKQSLDLIRDIDAQSHIRKVIKKMENKINKAKKQQQNQRISSDKVKEEKE